MEPYAFTDAIGRVWHVYDYRVEQDRKRALPINDRRAERRAFVPVTGGTVLIYEFGLVSYHTMEPKLVEYQLQAAKPLGASPAQRMQRDV